MTSSRGPSRRGLLLGAAAIVADAACATVARADRVHEGGPPVLGRFDTGYDGDAAHRARARNVELAAAAVDRTTMGPGELFSFNQVVGERTLAHGFERAVVLRGHLLAEATGGGACQVASTIHAAALLAGLSVVERAPHSRPSAYIRMGLDATVEYPDIDLRLRNPRLDRVLLRAHAARGLVHVWFEAEGPPRPRVSVATEILERVPFPRTVERDTSVPIDEVRVRNHGIPGYRVLRSRDVITDGVTRKDERTDVYPPVPEILVASPSFEVARLALGEPEDTPSGRIAPPRFVDEPGATRPALVQLRPTTRVVVDNG